jgi:ribosome-associated heat shock protein Hsp15
MTDTLDRCRLDKWLWAARFFKTRSLAQEAVDRGRIHVNGQVAKPSREVRPGDTLTLSGLASGPDRVITVTGVSSVRGPASTAATLYAESAVSLAQRAAWLESRRLAPEPATSRSAGRPTKRERRDLQGATDRWRRRSADIDDDPSR